MPKSEDTQGTTGRVLAGRYRLGEVLGRGGMGTVWRAVDETLGRQVAVKELRFPSSVDDDEKRRLITRTLREAKAIARVRASGGVTVYDVVDEDDRPWIVMELIEGSSLSEVIRDEGRLTPRRTAEVGLAVLDVLRAAHREGILHRDVKPSNVLISEDGSRIVLTDFGIAQVEGDPSVTSTGMLVGAPSYISPERARGHKPGPASDLWSLGGLLYACVEGVPPYDKGNGLATLTAVMTEPVPHPEHAGPLTEVILGLLEKEPEQRLDEAGARALLTEVLAAPEPPAPARTRAMPLPADGASDGAGDGASDGSADAGKGSGKGSGKNAGKGSGRKAGAAGGAAAAGSGDSGTAGEPAGPNGAAGAGAGDGAGSAGGKAAAASAPAVASPSAGAGPEGGAGSRVLTSVTRMPKQVLAAVAGVVVLAVLGLVLALNFGGDDSGAAGGEKKPSAGGGADENANGSGKGEKEEDGTGGKSPEPTADPTGDRGGEDDDSSGKGSGDDGDSGGEDEDSSGKGSGDGIPAGYRTVKSDGFRFSMAMPEGWKQTGTAGANSGGIYSESGGVPRIQVDFSSSPKDDAAATWRAQEQASRGSFPGYESRGIKSVDYRDYPTAADWEFEYTRSGERVRVVNRGFKVDDRRAYSIMVYCPAKDWDGKECSTLRETAYATFRPAG
ncbi:serine/threonine-protein kinase [Streptomyces zingiberis]|nr:serine/threonine-protein kinase [Streptomyces zingiberis]